MKEYSIKQIGADEYSNCIDIWNKKKFLSTENYIKEQIKAGNREVFVLAAEDEYIAMCDLVYNNPEDEAD